MQHAGFVVRKSVFQVIYNYVGGAHLSFLSPDVQQITVFCSVWVVRVARAYSSWLFRTYGI